MSNLRLHEGAGSFLFSDDVVGARRSIRIFYFCPQLSVRDARVVIAMHGLDRAAAEFCGVLTGQAERNGQIILVPEFDAEAFPGVHAYNYGNVRLAPPSPTVLPRNLWSCGIIDRLFDTCGSPSAPIGRPSYVWQFCRLSVCAALSRAD
jgi:hypothetical protein